MRRLALGLAGAGLLLAAGLQPLDAQGRRDAVFQRVGTFANYTNATLTDTTVSEIIAATADGQTLVYTDAELRTLGVIDIKDSSKPRAGGIIELDPVPEDDVRYTPTSVDIFGNKYALAAVDTSAGKKSPSGVLLVIDLDSRQVVASLDLGGQPDSVMLSPDRKYVAIAIENERDETLCVGGSRNDEVVSESACAAAFSAPCRRINWATPPATSP
jgi:hypothetical protein